MLCDEPEVLRGVSWYDFAGVSCDEAEVLRGVSWCDSAGMLSRALEDWVGVCCCFPDGLLTVDAGTEFGGDEIFCAYEVLGGFWMVFEKLVIMSEMPFSMSGRSDWGVVRRMRSATAWRKTASIWYGRGDCR